MLSMPVASPALAQTLGGAAAFPGPAGQIPYGDSAYADNAGLSGLSSFRFQSDSLLGTEERRAEVRDGDWSFVLHRTTYPSAAAREFASEGEASAFDTGTLDALLGYRFGRAARSFELLGGVRYLSEERFLDPLAPDRETTPGLLTPVVGARFSLSVSERWSLGLQGDLEGLGTHTPMGNASGLLDYAWQENRSLRFGYRVFGLDLSSGDARNILELDVEDGGPMIELDLQF